MKTMARNKRILSKDRFAETVGKDAIKLLPREKFEGKIIIIDKKEDVIPAIAELKKHQFLGIDTETKASFSSSKQNSVSLIQIASEDTCYLFRLNKIGFDANIIDIFEDPNIYKIGISLRDDIRVLKRVFEFQARAFVELQTLCPAYGIKDQSLQKIYGIVCGKYLSKSQRLSNWEADTLSEAQTAYAALDAYAVLNIYNSLMDKPNPNPVNFAIIK